MADFRALLAGLRKKQNNILKNNCPASELPFHPLKWAVR